MKLPIFALAILASTAFLISACGGESPSTDASKAAGGAQAAAAEQSAEGNAEANANASGEAEADQPSAEDDHPTPREELAYTGNPQARIVIQGRGALLIELFEDTTPNTVYNFVYLARQGAYDGMPFHRMVQDDTMSVIQGGDEGPEAEPEWTIQNEATLASYQPTGKNRNTRGTLAMARNFGTGVQALHSAGQQFFINLKDNIALDSPSSPFCVFGKIIAGYDVLDAMQEGDLIESISFPLIRDHHYIPRVSRPGDRYPKHAEPLPEAPETDTEANETSE